MDIGRELYGYLVKQEVLVNLLSQLKDEDGLPIVSVHRNTVPEFELAVAFCVENESSDFHVNDFLVFRQRDEFREGQLSPGLPNPDSVFFDVQIASHDLDRAIEIREAVEAVVNKLCGGCEDDPCEAILSQAMCGTWVASAELTGASEDSERITSANEWGLAVFDLDLTIKPDWSK